MDEEEEFDFSEWTVVDEDVGDNDTSPRKTNKNTTIQDRRRSSAVNKLARNTKAKSVSKTKDSSAATSTEKRLSKEESNKTKLAAKDVDQSSKQEKKKTNLVTKDVDRSSKEKSNKTNVTKAAKSTTLSDADVVESVICTNAVDSDKNNVKSASEKAAPTGESHEPCNKSSDGGKLTTDSTTHSEGNTTDISCSRTVQGISLMDTPGNSETNIPVVTKVSSPVTPSYTASSVPLREDTRPQAVSSELSGSQLTALAPSSLILNSTENKNIDVKVTCSQETASKTASAQLSAANPVDSAISNTPAASTASNTNQLEMQDTSSRALTKSSAQMKNPTLDVGSIAEIMAAVGKEDARVIHHDVEDVSDTELTDTMDIATYLVSEPQKTKVTGSKREASPNKGGPAIKKPKVQHSHSSAVSSASAAHEQPAGRAVRKDSRQSDKDSGNKNQKSPKQQSQSNRTEENTKTSARNQHAAGMSSTPKGSFGAAKTPGTKIKNPPAVSPPSAKTTTSSAAAKTNEVENKPSPGTTTSTTVRRIIRRFHRTTQTVSTECSNKLVQCLIKIPSLDAPPKPNCHSEVQASIEAAKDEVFYQRALPETVRPEIFKIVSAFNVNDRGSRNIITGSYTYGISLGHITAADVEKKMFREHLLSKSAYYSLYFDRKDFGVVDMFFGEEEHFLAVFTQLRKVKIGPRNLVVTYYKNLNESERAPGSTVSSVKVTIIYNQNFATTNFLAYAKAPLWNKPKAEEILTIHNMPEGIPLDFLKLLIPDAITIELDDKKQKFTQKGSCVHLGIHRKNSRDGFLKLFTQMYVNNECLAFSVLGTPVSQVPDLAEILAAKKGHENEIKNLKELKAVPRDISSTPYIGEEEKVEVIMQVDTVESAEKVSSLQMAARTGLSTLEKLQRPLGTAGSNKPLNVNNTAKDPALSDISDDLSDISDTSNIGVDAATPKISQKNTSSAQVKSTSMLNRTSRIQHKTSGTRQTEKKVIKREPHNGASRNNSGKSKVLKNDERRKETRDRLQDKDRKNSLSKPLGKIVRGTHYGKPERDNVRKENHNRVSRVSRSDRGQERSAPRHNIPENRVRDESEPSGGKNQRDRPRVENARRDSSNRLSSNRDQRRNAEDQGRHSQANSRTERVRHKSEERDNSRMKATSTVDRHGNKLVSFRDRGQSDRKPRDSQDILTEQFPRGKTDRVDVYNERDRRGSRLDLLVQKRLDSLERQEREPADSREVILTRSRSPIVRQVHRGRSTSPAKHQFMSVRVRQVSPSPTFGNQQRFNAVRSQLPQQRSHSSALSPISAREDETGDSPEGMWLPQSPSTLNFQQDMRKEGSSTRSANYVKPQPEWKSKVSQGEFEKESFVESQRFIKRFVEQMIGTGRAAARSAAPREKLSPSPFHDPSKVIEKIREIYNSRGNFNDDVSENDDDEILNSAVPSGGQNRSRPGDRAGPVASRNALRAPSNISSSSSHNTEPEPVGRFENRGDYERSNRDTGDTQRFDAPVNNRSEVFGRERGAMPSQTNSGGFREPRVSDQANSGGYLKPRVSDQSNSGEYMKPRVSDQSTSGRYRETGISNYSTSEGYQESGMRDQSNYEQYRESEIPNWQNSGGYTEFGMSNLPNSGGYREPETPYHQNSGGYRESEIPDHPGSGAYHQNPNQPLQPPIPPPVVPPQFNSMPSTQEKLAEFENMAHMIASDIENQHGPAAPNSAPGMWNNPSQASTSGPQTYTAGPKTYSAGPQLYNTGPQPYNTGPQSYNTGPQPYNTGPQFSFPGPEPARGSNMNFSGPPHPSGVPPNIHQPFLRGPNPQPAPWPQSNLF